MMRLVMAALLVTALKAPAAEAQRNPSRDEMKLQLLPSDPDAGNRMGLARPQPHPAVPPSSPPSDARAEPGRPPPSAGLPNGVRQVEPPRVNLFVRFATGSATLSPDAITVLRDLGSVLRDQDMSGFRFRVEGHTDTVGDRAFNQSLSEQRAEAVVQFLSTHIGVDRARLEPIGLGEEAPLVRTPDNTAEARNRRVQIVNLGR